MNLDLSSITTIPPSSSGVVRDILQPLSEPGHFLLILDNTSLEKWKRCPAAAMWYLVYRREPHARNAALTFGGAIHEGLDLYHHHEFHKITPQTGPTFDLECSFGDEVQVSRILSYFASNPTPPDEYRTPQTAVEVLGHYRRECAIREDYQWTIQADASGPIIERPFELPIGVIEVNSEIQLPSWPEPRFVSHVHVAWSGRIDLVALTNGMNRIVDHKTSSIDGEQFIQSFSLSSQTLGYVWAGRQLWPDLDIRGFCLNCLRLKKPSGGVGLMDRGPRGGDPALKFFRTYYDYTPERLAEWTSDTLAHISDFLACLTRSHFPLNDRQCFDKFGKCGYHDICTLDSHEVRARFINTDAYKSVTWNPTDER